MLSVEYLAPPANQAAAFGALAALSAVLSVLCCVQPEAVIDVALPKVRQGHAHCLSVFALYTSPPWRPQSRATPQSPFAGPH
jgi:hypothetical protein